MFQLSNPWWELVARAAVVYVALMLMMRLAGKRTVGQFTPFDLLVVLLLSEGVSTSLTGDEVSLPGGLIVAGTLMALNLLIAIVSARSRKFETLLEGVPVLLVRDGKIFYDMLKRERVGLGDLEKRAREADCDMNDVRFEFLETDGSISILKKDSGA